MRVRDRKTVLIPDRRGNNRIDGLRNIVRDPRISLLFLIPGIGTTVRINGRAGITTDPELCASFAMQGKVPRSVLVVTAERVYFQCPKALVRSRLWSKEAQISPSEVPSTGEMLRPSPRAASTARPTIRPIRSGSRKRCTEEPRVWKVGFSALVARKPEAAPTDDTSTFGSSLTSTRLGGSVVSYAACHPPEVSCSCGWKRSL